jgi:hypothetical protein
VHLGKGRGYGDGDAQETSHFHRRAEQFAEQHAAGILEHQDALTAISHKLERLHRPGAIQLILEGVFVSKAIKSSQRRLLRCREYDQYILAPASRALTPAAAKDEPAILRQDLKLTDSARAEL